MQIVTKVSEMQKISDEFRRQKKTIGFVPTMGYFHEGHLSLMKRAKDLSDVVMASLFVNPTQFGPNEDFERYPRDYKRDISLAGQSGVEYFFMPDVREMYPGGYKTEINISGMTEKFEGVTRPTHFNGVATVVAKLFNAVKPHFAVFGQKDYQQTLLIRQLVRDLLFDINIVVAPTLREDDGLAMSSRNVYLSPEDRSKAVILYNTLETARQAIEGGERRRKIINAIMHKSLRSEPTIKIDYASSATADNLEEPEEFVPGQLIVLLLAVYLGKTRLIDNALITLPAETSPNSVNFKEGF